MDELQPALSAMMPNTRYFELDSAAVGDRFAVWVTTPPEYALEEARRFPVVYMPDGNLNAPMTAPRHLLLSQDPIAPIQPLIQVCVGYAADATAMIMLRNRDLVPAGEPVSQMHVALADEALAAGKMTQDMYDGFFDALADTRADRFLSFLTDELHPAIAAAYRIDETGGAGLFGYSYGGLFTLYAALQCHGLFTRIGAGSPGVMSRESLVLGQLKEAGVAGTDFNGLHLHITVNELEITAPTLYRLLGENFATLVHGFRGEGMTGIRVTSTIVPAESHATGLLPSWYGFLRACYPAPTAPQDPAM